MCHVVLTTLNGDRGCFFCVFVKQKDTPSLEYCKDKWPEHSFRRFYYDSIQPRIASPSELSYDVVRADVGTSKEEMDNADLELPVIQSL